MNNLQGHFLFSHTIPLVKLRKNVILNIDSGIVLENFDSSWKRNNKGQIPTAVVSSHAPLQEQKSRKGVRELLPLLLPLLLPFLLPLLQNPFTEMEFRKKISGMQPIRSSSKGGSGI